MSLRVEDRRTREGSLVERWPCLRFNKTSLTRPLDRRDFERHRRYLGRRNGSRNLQRYQHHNLPHAYGRLGRSQLKCRLDVCSGRCWGVTVGQTINSSTDNAVLIARARGDDSPRLLGYLGLTKFGGVGNMLTTTTRRNGTSFEGSNPAKKDRCGKSRVSH